MALVLPGVAIVPLEECKIPTLIPSPAGTAALEAVGEAEGLGVVFVALGGVQDFRSKLPAALAPKIKISRRRIFLAIEINYSSSVCEILHVYLARSILSRSEPKY